jgi:hypothetical protein
LLKVSPLVAQLISVPDDLSLEELHDVLQLVLGWSGQAFSSVFMKVEIRSPYLSVVLSRTTCQYSCSNGVSPPELLAKGEVERLERSEAGQLPRKLVQRIEVA